MAKIKDIIFEKPLSSYAFFYFLFLSPFLFAENFAGNTDVIVHTTLFKEYILKLKELTGGQTYGYSFYPSNGTSLFLENMYGHTLLFIIGKILFMPDYLASVFILWTVLILNGIAVYKFIYIFTKNLRASYIMGFFFPLSSFMMANVEFLNGITVFPFIFSLYYLEKYRTKKISTDFYLAVLFLGLQTFFSGYYFLEGSFLFLIFILANWINKEFLPDSKKLLYGALILLVLCIPTFIRLSSSEFAHAYNPFREFNLEVFTIKFKSFFLSAPGNLVYGRFYEYFVGPFRANTGILFFILFTYGIYKGYKSRGFMLSIAFIAAFLSTGSYFISIGDIQIPSLFKITFDWNFLGNYFRLPYRFYTITLLLFTLSAAWGYHHIEKKIKHPSILAVTVLMVLLAENIEPRQYTVDQKYITNLPAGYDIITKKKNEQPVQVAEFPSSLFTHMYIKKEHNEYRREFIYMYRQTFHHQNIINGSASYFPKARVENNNLMIRISENNNLHQLIQKNQLSYLTFHKNLVYHPSEWEILSFFEQSNLLNKQYEDDTMVIFSTNI